MRYETTAGCQSRRRRLVTSLAGARPRTGTLTQRTHIKIRKIQIITISSPPSSNNSAANTTLNFWIKNYVMSTIIQHSLTRQQFSVIMSSMLQSLRIAYSFPQCQNPSPQLPTVPIQRLSQRSRLLVLCEFENFAVTSVAIK